MKKGDNLYCKKNYELKTVYNIKGKIYEILSIIILDSDIVMFIISSESFIMTSLNLTRNSIVMDKKDVLKYFLTPMEFRKLKLKKLNDRR